MMPRIVVTGAAGFIGSHVVSELARRLDYEIFAIDNLKPSYGGDLSKIRRRSFEGISNVHFYRLDLSDVALDELSSLFSNSECVIHLAAWPGVRSSQLHPHQYSKANLVGFSNVLEAVRLAKPLRFFFASSSSVYGDLGSFGPVKESMATGTNLKSYYAATKWTNEILAKSHHEFSGIPTLAMRFFTVYGKFGRPDMAYWTFLEKMIRGEEISLYGETGGTRNFTPVEDVVAIIIRLLDVPLHGYQSVNIASGGPIKTIDFLSSLENISGLEARIRKIERPSSDVETTWADLSKLTDLIGDITPTQLEIALRSFSDWYQLLDKE